MFMRYCNETFASRGLFALPILGWDYHFRGLNESGSNMNESMNLASCDVWHIVSKWKIHRGFGKERYLRHCLRPAVQLPGFLAGFFPGGQVTAATEC